MALETIQPTSCCQTCAEAASGLVARAVGAIDCPAPRTAAIAVPASSRGPELPAVGERLLSGSRPAGTVGSYRAPADAVAAPVRADGLPVLKAATAPSEVMAPADQAGTEGSAPSGGLGGGVSRPSSLPSLASLPPIGAPGGPGMLGGPAPAVALPAGSLGGARPGERVLRSAGEEVATLKEYTDAASVTPSGREMIPT